jgi:hypothetical protein
LLVLLLQMLLLLLLRRRRLLRCLGVLEWWLVASKFVCYEYMWEG